MTNKHLTELKDIADIDLISWWPLATGWWLVIAGIVLILGYLAYKANKYMKRGKIKDAVFGKKPESKDSETSSLSFSSWKLWRKGKTD